MKPLSIQKTTDAYPGLTPFEREKLFKEDRVIEKMKLQVCKAFGFQYSGFTNEQVRQFHFQIFK